jgi:hypothetical protein
MSHDDLALLRALATRPIVNVPASCKDRIAALAEAGYVTEMPEGWIATALGCSVIQERRAPERR